MKALTLHDFEHGPKITDMPTPSIASNEVLVRIHAASINAFDVKLASGGMKGTREYQFPFILGKDAAGVVEKVGTDVINFRPGDEVIGFYTGSEPHGTFAEFIPMTENMLALKPTTLDFMQAAALAVAGCTAFMAVDAIHPTEDDVVLVIGATGGVGSFAIQFAAQRGAIVIATAKPEDTSYLQKLGVDSTIDYTAQDVIQTVLKRYPNGIQGLIDLVNFQPQQFSALAELVTSNGRVASTVGAADVEHLAARNVGATNIMANPSVLKSVARAAELGVIQIPIARVYQFEEAQQAFSDFDKQHTTGKLVVAMT